MAKFMRAGTSKAFFSPTIASTSLIPTAAELDSATELSAANVENLLTEIEGFDSTTNFIDVEPFASRQGIKIPGRQESSDSSMTFTEDTVSNPVMTLLARDTVGFIIMSRNGATIAGSKVDVFPVQVASVTPQYTTGNEAATFVVSFGVTGIPAQNVSVAA